MRSWSTARLVFPALLLGAAAAAAPPDPAPSPAPAPAATPRIAEPARAVAEPAGVESVALLVHAPAVPGALSLAKTVADVLSASGIRVRTGRALLETLGAPSADPFSPVRVHVAAASKHYLMLDLAGADAELRAAEDALVPLLPDPEAVIWTRRILELRAVVLMAQERVDASTEKLSALFLLDPEYRADERFLSPQFQPAFEKAAEEAALAPRGTFTVRSDPPGAEIYVDGKPVGIAPVMLELRAGQHVLQGMLNTRSAAGVAVRVDPSVPGELTLSLPALEGDALRAALARSVATGVLPGGRAQVATNVRRLSKSDAVAVVLARPSLDGTLLSGEVHWDDPRIPPSRTPEFRLTSVASANARALANGLEKILSGPKPEPIVWKGRYIPPEVVDPFTLQVALGRVDNYGTGWSKTDIPNRLVSSTLNFTGVFRQQEQPHVALDWAFAVGVISGTKCYGGPAESCRTITSNQLFLDIGPRLDFRWNRVSAFGGAGLGVGNHEMRIQPVPDAPVQSDTVVVARAFLLAGFGVQVTRNVRIVWEEKIATAQGTFPTTITRDYDAKHLNVGGITSQAGVSYRF